MAEYELEADRIVAASTNYQVLFEHDVAAGKSVLYGTISPEDIMLQELVPAGKSWTVKVLIQVVETDA